MKVKIALAQMEITKDISKNLDKISRFIRSASRASANIVVFPEICITGDSTARKYEDKNQKYMNFFINMAKKNQIDIVSGSIIEKDKGWVYNTSYYIDSKGKVLARYRKRNLWISERRSVMPGNKYAVANTRYGKIGLLICWDIIKPEFFKELTQKGTSIVICPSYWWYARNLGVNGEFMKSLIKTRTFENEVIIAYCNAAGKTKKRELLGRSQISVPYWLERLQCLDHNREAMLIADVDTKLVKSAERIYKLRS